MIAKKKNPRVLIVTPEVTYLPPGMGNMANYFRAKAGGLADVSAALVSALFKLGADVHVALPDFRTVFYSGVGPVMRKELSTIRSNMPEDRIHLAEDRAFFYQSGVYSNYPQENFKISLAFQREVINHIIPQVQPDLIHCNDWMTGLIPGQARWMGIPCLFTIHNIHTEKYTLDQIEDRGLDAASFWQALFYERPPLNYEESRNNNRVDFLTSGVFGAHFVNTVSPTFLTEIIEGRHKFIQEPVQKELTSKWHAECATGILNAPDPSYNPASDKSLPCTYGPKDHQKGKLENKRYLQKNLGLARDDKAPIFFWPSRLDPIQKGCQLLADIMYDVVAKYWNNNLQIVVVANGEYQRIFRDIVLHHDFHDRVAIQNFDERLSRIAFAASDFVLMPSSFEPCGLPQMIGATYGSLPVAHDTGGIHDTVWQMDVQGDNGNGFLYEVQDTQGLWWAFDKAMEFYTMPPKVKQAQITRVMQHSLENFNHEVNAQKYIELYEKMLNRPLINGVGGKSLFQSSSDEKANT
ncbi:MAG: glycogen/starch synthase [Desulfatibacillum sp.]|nr:glycogen/starch synthase [Desulfatibacillum sp.]